MQILKNNNENIFSILFNEKETNNIRALLHNPIDYRNTKLCYCIEQALPTRFDEFKIKRPMILKVESRLQLYNFKC